RLRSARDETRRSQIQLEEQRAYLEAVLARLSTGVITFDNNRRLVTVNHAANQILGIDLQFCIGMTLDNVGAAHRHLLPFSETVALHLDDASGDENFADWREQMTLLGVSGRQILMCSGAPLRGVDGEDHGHVMVFDDITTLIEAQRSAAWSEVARRLAHEIKNPLTPIQLSAERLRHKYLPSMSGKDAEGMDRLTRTIVQQVESMKEMVNAFSDYARTPRMEPMRLDVNSLITDVIELYKSDEFRQNIRLELGDLPPLIADPDRLRQILHNLVKNAIEASKEDKDNTISVETQCVREAARIFIELRVRDSGRGFPEEFLDKGFEPYVTTKAKGSGLGLAIVKRIVEEHGGIVWAENHDNGGASVIIQLPVSLEDTAADEAAEVRREAV
ncbi:MAG: ATP-binding protein, partial [Gammaproteobacteria bacterium]|nr:ATP-binding protein [Gammaproteobacteria bacterium]